MWLLPPGSKPVKNLIQCGMEQLVARRAHNPKVVSSSLAPATGNVIRSKLLRNT